MPAERGDYTRWYEIALQLASVSGQCVEILACAAGACQQIGRVCPPGGTDDAT